MNQDLRFTLLEDRGLLTIGGNDAGDFLQGLISNDIHKVGPERAIYAALLTPQGKYLHDFFIVEMEGALFLECERGRLDDLKKRLTLYKLRADVTLQDRSGDFAVAALYGDGWSEAAGVAEEAGAAAPFNGGIVFTDPRLKEAGGRAVLPRESAEDTLKGAGFRPANVDDYDRHRLILGLPDGSRDLITEKSTLLESGFDELNGVDWNKGCYMGQELTARTKYRGLVKKRLMPVTFDGPPPPTATPVMAGEKAAGEIRSSIATEDGGIGLALIRLDALENSAELTAGDIAVIPEKPGWMAV